LSLTSGCRKNKITELVDDRRLTLCHEKVGGTKALMPPPGKKCWGGCFLSFLGFTITGSVSWFLLSLLVEK